MLIRLHQLPELHDPSKFLSVYLQVACFQDFITAGKVTAAVESAASLLRITFVIVSWFKLLIVWDYWTTCKLKSLFLLMFILQIPSIGSAALIWTFFLKSEWCMGARLQGCKAFSCRCCGCVHSWRCTRLPGVLWCYCSHFVIKVLFSNTTWSQC